MHLSSSSFIFKVFYWLLIQAAAVILPYILWKNLSPYSGTYSFTIVSFTIVVFFLGIDINKIIKSAQEEHKKVAENIEKVANDLTVSFISKHETCLFSFHTLQMFMKSRSFAIFYISIKLVGILNCMVELLLIYG